MPLTLTGRSVTMENGVAPSLVDIAVGLSRMPRFAGQTRRWWSVLDHTLFGDELVKAGGGGWMREARLAWLFHDAHEAMTGDVPTPFKTVGLRATQHELDRAIFGAYCPGGIDAAQGFMSFVKDVDRRCLTAEAMTVGPPTAEQHPVAFGLTLDSGPQFEKDQDLLQRMVWKGDIVGIPPLANNVNPEEHPAVRAFLARYMELR